MWNNWEWIFNGENQCVEFLLCSKRMNARCTLEVLREYFPLKNGPFVDNESAVFVIVLSEKCQKKERAVKMGKAVYVAFRDEIEATPAWRAILMREMND